LVTLIRQAKRDPVERDTLYNEIRNFGTGGPERPETSTLLN
jgi:2-iminoacetate synthase ThiH